MKIKDTEPKVVKKNEGTGRTALRLGIWDQRS